MNLTLRRGSFTPEGIFGHLFDEKENVIAVTLEHSYGCIPKLAPGVYLCERHAPNRLPYETFEVQNVPDFQGQPVTGLLLHIGNFNKDSSGCILLGLTISGDMITGSKLAFNAFMEIQKNVETFSLTVS